MVAAEPVLDAKGEIVATLSASDIRGMTKENMKDLMLPVVDFLKKRSGTDSLRKQEVVSTNFPLGKAINKLLDAGIHRLWIVGEGEAGVSKNVAAVMSFTDIIRKVSKFNISRHHK
mmetsp:Transcript_8250/g.16218  ORF Transcript_8250/g.16218 Transcript_8250/m.16218 type:complete len:116 (-) Transcript_8250:513-860(-)